MALYTVALNQTAEPLDVNQLVNTLQKPSGGVEAGKYYWTFWATANAQTSGMYVATQSRGSTPVSVFIDHADGFPSTINAPLYSNVTSNGFEVYAAANAASNNNGVGGNWTVQY
jgi:hypothetical protein